MSQTHVRIDDHRHQKMKDLAKQNKRNIQEEYAEAIDQWIAGKYQETILADSKLEQLVMKKLSKSEDRMAALISRTGMDISIVLMALTAFISEEKGMDRGQIYNVFRQEAKEYFSRPLKNNKE